MAMTKLERLAKEEVLNILSEEGYPTYASLLSKFDVNLTADPGVVGYMEPSKGRIVLNKGLDIEQVSVIARHEILHEYLTHELRLLQHLAASAGLDFDELDDIKVGDLRKDLYKNKNFNIAADYEISNLGYTAADKETVRNIQLNGKSLCGLVTEDEHPDWVNMSVEEMYDELNKQIQKNQQQAKQDLQNQPGCSPGQPDSQGNDGDSAPQIGDRGDQQIQEAEEIERQAEEIADQAEQAQQNPGGGQQSSNDSDSEEDEGDEPGGGIGGDESDSDEYDSDEPGDGFGGGTPGDEGDESESEPGDSTDGEGTSLDTPEHGGPGEGGTGERSERNKELKDLENKADQVADAASDLQDKIEQEKGSEEPKVFKTPEEKKRELENEKRLKEIKKMFSDVKMQSQIIGETQEAVRAEQRKKAERNLAQYKASPLNNFKMSLEGFVKNLVSVEKGSSWSKINKTYAHSGIMKPGRTRYTAGKIPTINVYFDQSSSWDYNDIKVGEQAIATLNKYVKQNLIDIKLFYFSTWVSGDRNEVAGGGTDLAPVITHINATKPDNVIIMTDSDGDWTHYNGDATVPGAVWFLWKGVSSKELQKHLKGKQLTKSFMLKG